MEKLAGILLLVTATITQSIYGQPPDSVNWELVWQDEFNGDTLDYSKWSLGQEWDQDDCDYPELPMVNGKELIEVSDGTLKMKSWNEPSGGKPYTGSLIKTRQSGTDPPFFTLQYGYVEVKLRRLVQGEGFHMNAYTFAFDSTKLATSDKGGHVWPPEIDYAETLSREYYRDRILNALHTGYGDDEEWIEGIDWSDWHVYAFNWKEDGYVDFYMDGNLIYSSEKKLLPDLPQYLLIRIGVGGWIGEVNEQTGFPGAQEVDWVRAYKRIQNVSNTLVAPHTGDIFSPEEVITIDSDPVAVEGEISKVEYYANDSLIGEAFGPDFSFEWSGMEEGRYSIHSVAYDDQGRYRKTGPVFITVGDVSSNEIFNPGFEKGLKNWDLEENGEGSVHLSLDSIHPLSGN